MIHKFTTLLLILIFGFLSTARGTGEEIQPQLSISLSPSLLKPEQWGILSIVQIHKGGVAGTVELNAKAVKRRALFAKKTDVTGWVDKGETWGLRVQVYLIRPISTQPLNLTVEDFTNVSSNTIQPLVIATE